MRYLGEQENGAGEQTICSPSPLSPGCIDALLSLGISWDHGHGAIAAAVGFSRLDGVWMESLPMYHKSTRKEHEDYGISN